MKHTIKMGKGKEKKEMEKVKLAESIQGFSPWKKERFYEFAKDLLVDAENEPPKQDEDKLSFEKIIVYSYPKNAKKETPRLEQEKELIEKALFLNILDESGAGILCYSPVYAWYDVFKGKKHTLQRLQREWHGFVDIEGNFKHDLNTVSEEGLKKFFMQNPACEGIMGFAVEIFDVDALNRFTEKLREHIDKKEQELKSSNMPELTVHAKEGKFRYGEVKWGHKGARGKILKELMKKPLYENFSGDNKKEGNSVSIQTLHSVGFPKESKNAERGFLIHPKKRNLNPDRAVRDAIEDIRGKLSNIIQQENQRMGLPEDYSPGEIRAIDNSFLLVIRKKQP